MTAEMSVPFEPETIELAQRAADLDGVPLAKWLDRTAREAAYLAEARAALEERFAEYGEPSDEVMAEARTALDTVGVGRPIPMEDIKAGKEALAYLDRLSGVDEE